MDFFLWALKTAINKEVGGEEDVFISFIFVPNSETAVYEAAEQLAMC